MCLFLTDQTNMVLLDIGSFEMNCIYIKMNIWELEPKRDWELKILSRRILTEKSILDHKKGVLIPHCTVKCGDYLKNSTLKKGAPKVFLAKKKADENDTNHTVALSSPHVISSGEIACSTTGGRFGECIWPENSSNIHDVSIIQIEPSSVET